MTTTKTEQLNRPIEEYELPDPILTEGVDYHERPDWKKQLKEAEEWIAESVKLKKDDPVLTEVLRYNLTECAGFPKTVLLNKKVNLIGKKCSKTVTPKTTHFVYNHQSIDFDCGHEWRLNCGIPCFLVNLKKYVIPRRNLIGPDGTRRSGEKARTYEDLQQWIAENIPFRTPSFKASDFIDGLGNGKWYPYVNAVRQVCIDLQKSDEEKAYWRGLMIDQRRSLMKQTFSLHTTMFPIEGYHTRAHRDFRTIIRAMELVRGVKFNGGIVFIEGDK